MTALNTILIHLDTILGIFCDLGPFWVHLGAHLGRSWASLGAILGHLGPSWARSWAILGDIGPILGPILGDPLRSCAVLGPSWGASWAILCHLGAILGHLGPFWGMPISVGNCRESCRIALSCFSGRNAMAQRTLLPVRCLRGRRGHYLHIAVRSCEIARDLYTPHFRTQHRCAKTRLHASVSALVITAITLQNVRS